MAIMESASPYLLPFRKHDSWCMSDSVRMGRNKYRNRYETSHLQGGTKNCDRIKEVQWIM
jgi:hypothetical protein